MSHVLILAWYVRSQRLVFLGAACYAVLTAISTLYLGWHYVSDWFGGALVAAVAILLTSRFCRDAPRSF